MSGLFPLSRSQIFKSGAPAGGARLRLFDGGTSTPRVGYRDSSLTSAHPDPIIADADGRLPVIFLETGFYRQRLTTSTGVLIFDDDGLPVVDTVVAGGGTSVDPDSVFKTRDIKIRFDDSTIDGYVRLNGKSIGSASSGATERANVDTQSLYEELWGFANIAVTGGKGASAAADFAASKPLVLPNAQGAALFGLSDMGGTADTAFAALLSGADTAKPGATGGADTVTIGQANLPAVNLTGTGTITVVGTSGNESATHTHGVTDPTHSHKTIDTPLTITSSNLANTPGAGQTGGGAISTALDTANTGAAATGISINNTSQHHTHDTTSTGAASQLVIPTGGSGTAVNKLPSLITLMIYIRL